MTTQNQGDKHFKELLGLYLKQNQTGTPHDSNQPHLDEDTLSAFVEGTLVQRQSAQIIKHLIGCVFCRRVTVQLAELNESFNDIAITNNQVATNSWRELWSNLTESVSRPYDNAVVAHEEDKENSREQDGGGKK